AVRITSLSLHDALPISAGARGGGGGDHRPCRRGTALRGRRSGAMTVIRAGMTYVGWAIAAIALAACGGGDASPTPTPTATVVARSEEHTSELQSRENLV